MYTRDSFVFTFSQYQAGKYFYSFNTSSRLSQLCSDAVAVGDANIVVPVVVAAAAAVHHNLLWNTFDAIQYVAAIAIKIS